LETDAALLEKYTRRNSEAAFKALVARHSAMVHGVCTRVLENRVDADDAGQATFIALALKAHRLDASEGLGGWLHRVARLTALSLRRTSTRRQARNSESAWRVTLENNNPPLAGKLDEAIEALPKKLRATIIEHYLESVSIEEIARRYQCTPSAISMRLTRGRELLRNRLNRKGIGFLAATLLADAAEAAKGFNPDFSTLGARTAVAIAKGLTASNGPAAALLALANRSLRNLLFAKLKWPMAAVALGLLAFQLNSIAQIDLTPKANPAPSAPAKDLPAPAMKPPADVRPS
jgi:RNA polymerase sigma factor (sigma-70 family)